ncbi:PREDICTED: uncharacterized protein LOC104706001 [Camelina sativa]|uniref:Uncharacterized protein LOC104706001 n=1 Tax=Camelina sativa TaxID=90675 RepID=A0ABM0T3N4_CAMSA|nr:PREDICTED: uncharacterized protein LOC104706001 [Camelina sativa]
MEVELEFLIPSPAGKMSRRKRCNYANNQFFHVAWAVVRKENIESWLWFIQKLKTDLKLQDGTGFTLISHRQKGLLNVVDQELPKMEHRARHTYGNLRRVYPGSNWSDSYCEEVVSIFSQRRKTHKWKKEDQNRS